MSPSRKILFIILAFFVPILLTVFVLLPFLLIFAILFWGRDSVLSAIVIGWAIGVNLIPRKILSKAGIKLGPAWAIFLASLVSTIGGFALGMIFVSKLMQ